METFRERRGFLIMSMQTYWHGMKRLDFIKPKNRRATRAERSIEQATKIFIKDKQATQVCQRAIVRLQSKGWYPAIITSLLHPRPFFAISQRPTGLLDRRLWSGMVQSSLTHQCQSDFGPGVAHSTSSYYMSQTHRPAHHRLSTPHP